MNALIVSNGNINEYEVYKKYFDQSDIIICCDGGASHLRSFNVIPDVLLGDFDSISENDFNYFKGKSVKILKYPVKKEVTDTEIAVDYAIEQGADTITLIASVGSRLDHSIANIFLLNKMISKNVRGIIVDNKNMISLITNEMYFEKETDCKLSLIPLTQVVEGITTEGLSYPLFNAIIKQGSTRGVSNEFISKTAKVTIKSGILIAILSKD